VIEAKRQWSRGPCLKDLNRLHGLVSRLAHQNGGSLRRGFLAMTVVRQDKGEADRRKTGSATRLGRYGLRSGGISTGKPSTGAFIKATRFTTLTGLNGHGPVH